MCASISNFRLDAHIKRYCNWWNRHRNGKSWMRMCFFFASLSSMKWLMNLPSTTQTTTDLVTINIVVITTIHTCDVLKMALDFAISFYASAYPKVFLGEFYWQHMLWCFILLSKYTRHLILVEHVCFFFERIPTELKEKLKKKIYEIFHCANDPLEPFLIWMILIMTTIIRCGLLRTEKQKENEREFFLVRINDKIQ